MAEAIAVKGLWKSYRDVQAVQGIDFTVVEGQFFAFLGVNGAGKSTTINCMTTLLRPDAGSIAVGGFQLGRDDQSIRDAIGVVFQRPLLDLALSVRENLELRGEFHSLVGPAFHHRVEQLTALLGLEEFVDRRYGKLSGGQQRRADIARALLHSPKVLFLDEPTAGLDPHSREQVWQAITDIRQTQGMTVFLTTHYMEETERADQVAIIQDGRIIAHGPPDELRQRHSRSQLNLRLSWRPGLKERLRQLDQLPVPGWNPDQPLDLDLDSTDQAKRTLAALWDWVVDFEFRHGSMDDVFLNLTDHRAPAPAAVTAATTPAAVRTTRAATTPAVTTVPAVTAAPAADQRTIPGGNGSPAGPSDPRKNHRDWRHGDPSASHRRSEAN
ncbi:MAG: ABC transporter ATP-binding protein [Propionibacteriaceae bacterium]|jgi:multidrug/hemolysin transport system ATP-binding protein|nr:ABC transporter ATP-binding protein [Propionibacteriaceae bacterium]